MSYTVEWTARARARLSNLDEETIIRLIRKVEEIKSNPKPRLRRLTKIKCWRLRVGDYRILLDVDAKSRKLTVLTLGHRKKIGN